MFRRFILFDANAAGGGTTSNSDESTSAGDNSAGNSTTLTFDDWQASLPDDQKVLIEDHTRGLKSALESERGTRKDLEKQLRDLAKEAEKGSKAETQLTQLADQLQTADRRANFYELAHMAGVKNLKLAYTVAVNDEMFDKHDRVNFDEMKKQYPELFVSTKPPRGDAGSGTESTTTQASDMNTLIRRRAGRS